MAQFRHNGDRPLKAKRRRFERLVYTLYNKPPDFADNVDVCCDDDAPHPDAPMGLPALPRVRRPDLEGQLEEWMEVAIARYDFISIGVRTDNEPFILFQVIDFSRKLTTVPVFDDQKKRISLQWTIHRYSLSLGEELPDEPRECVAFTAEDPAVVELLSWTGLDPQWRLRCRRWERREHDVEGLWTFRDPRPLAVDMPLKHNAVPVLCLLDELSVRDFLPIQSRVVHAADAEKMYDARSPSRSYLQCVLSLDWLVRNGVESFHSGRAQAYYRLLLRAPARALEELRQGDGQDLGRPW